MEETGRLKIPIEVLQDVFFEAMLAGWVSNFSQPVAIKGLSHSHKYEFKQETNYGKVTVIDVYFTQEGSPYSHGFIHMYFRNDLVWVMRYAGEYDENTIRVVKQALCNAYHAKKFYGGRGCYKDGSNYFYHFDCTCAQSCYLNVVDDGSCFSHFSGKETATFGETSFGHHTYEGGLILLP